MSIYDDPTATTPPPPTEAPPAPDELTEEAPPVPTILSSAELFPNFLQEIERNRTGKPMNIGFPCLQRIIRSALIKGLICIGAAPSIGKTAFVMQIAFSVAAARNPRNVLIFSLEMPRNELTARDVSRLTYMLPRISGAFKGEPRTTAEILSGSKFDRDTGERVNFSEQEQQLITQAYGYYKQVAERIYICETEQQPTAEFIASVAEKFTADHDGEPPVIFIDYLQLITAEDPRADERRTQTRSTYIFKNLSKSIGDGKGTTIFAISATARMNYYETDPEGFGKESGGIEYTADATLFMQYAPAFENYTASGKTEADRWKNKENACKAEGAKDDREIIVSVIKNRAGQRNQYIKYTFHAKYNTYQETGVFFRSFKENEKEKKGYKIGSKKNADELTDDSGEPIDL